MTIRRLRQLIDGTAVYAPDGGSVPAAGDVPGDKGGTQNNQQPQNRENNTTDNDEIFASMWDEPKPDPNTAAKNNNGTDGGNNGNAGEAFNEYVESLNFSDGIDVDQITSDLQAGNNKSFSAALSKAGQNAYKKAMLDSHKMIKQSVEKAVGDAVTKSRGHVAADQAIRDLNDRFPYTKDKAIAPVAEGVLKQFMSKGQDYETAQLNTDKYFKRTGELVNKTGTRRNQGFGNNADSSNSLDEPAEIDFMNILTMKDDE